MKRLFLIGAVMSVLAVCTSSTAQKKASYISIGPTGNFGHSWTSNINPGSRVFKPSGSLGIGLVYSRHEHWGFGAQALVSHEGYSWKRRTVNNQVYENTVNPVYLRIPLSVNYFFNDYGKTFRPKVYIGPSFGVKIDERQDLEIPYGTENGYDGSDMFRTFDLGIQTGAGANVQLKKGIWLNFDLGYYLGLLDAVDISGDDSYNMNQNLRANIGVMFGL